MGGVDQVLIDPSRFSVESVLNNIRAIVKKGMPYFMKEGEGQGGEEKQRMDISLRPYTLP